MTDKTIYVIPGATLHEIDAFGEMLNSERNIIFTNNEVKVFYKKGDELFEVVNELKKVNE